MSREDADDPVRCSVWQRREQHAVHSAEDRRVRADPQGEGEDGNGGERRTSSERPPCVADIEQQVSEELAASQAALECDVLLSAVASGDVEIAEAAPRLLECALGRDS